MKPAAMLVRPLEVEIGRKAELFIAAKYRFVGRPGIEPYVERVGELAVLRGIDAEILVRRLEPGFDSAVLDLRRGQLEQRRRIRVQLVGGDVDEERQRHAPLALAR